MTLKKRKSVATADATTSANHPEKKRVDVKVSKIEASEHNKEVPGGQRLVKKGWESRGAKAKGRVVLFPHPKLQHT